MCSVVKHKLQRDIINSKDCIRRHSKKQIKNLLGEGLAVVPCPAKDYIAIMIQAVTHSDRAKHIKGTL
jgi:hypothetical protein